MDRLTKLNGIGEFELQACFDCGSGAGPDNENCGNCQKSLDAYQRLGEYEETGLAPDQVAELRQLKKESEQNLTYVEAYKDLLAKSMEINRKLLKQKAKSL